MSENIGVEITLRDIYNTQVEMLDSIRALSQNHELTREHVVRAQTDISELNKRLREVEIRVWAIPGVAVILGAAGLLLSLGQILTRH